jgi:RES domain-containing protein
MPDKLEHLLENIATQKLISFSGTAYRMHNPVWAWSPLSRQGAKITGGRFNPKGMGALYLSLNANTCIAEVSGGTSSKLLDPQLLCSYQIDIDGLLDLRNEYDTFALAWRIMRLQKLSPPGWKLAKAALENSDIKGFLVPSYQVDNECNLVLLRWQKGDVTLHDPDNSMKAVYGSKLITDESKNSDT